MIIELLLLVIIAGLLWDNFSDTPLISFGNKRKDVTKIIADMKANNISLDDIAQAIANPDLIKESSSQINSDVAMKIFAWLGGIFIFAGISVYIGMFWHEISSFMRIFITLGTGIALSLFSVIVMKENKYPKLVLPLIFVTVGIETSGWFVLVDELFPHTGNIHKAASVIFALMALQQAVTFYFFKRNILAFTSVLFIYSFFHQWLEYLTVDEKYIALILGGCLIYTAFIISKTAHRYLSEIFYFFGIAWFNAGIFAEIEYLTDSKFAAIATGLSIMSTAYALKISDNKNLSGIGFFFGSEIFYAGLFDLLQHTNFELIYFAISVSMLYFCTLFASRALLTTTVISILSFIGYYTNEHFAHSLGWAISLIILGVAFFAVSALAIKIKNKYISNK